MRVCPKCGYFELIWRHLQHGRFTDYCHINELEIDFPKLANVIKKSPKFFTDETLLFEVTSEQRRLLECKQK